MRVTLSARAIAPLLQGETRPAGGAAPNAVRGQLVSVATPRAAVLGLQAVGREYLSMSGTVVSALPRQPSRMRRSATSCTHEKTEGRGQRRQAGFALILAILSLMLLTFLGLTLAATTSTELQIATNYRWSQQALYNAEAGLEAAKLLLAQVAGGRRRTSERPADGARPGTGATG